MNVTAGVTAAAGPQSTLEIRGINSPTTYSVVVSDSNGSGGGNLESNDNVVHSNGNTTFQGEVGDGGTDTYFYEGEILYALADGAVAIDPDGGTDRLGDEVVSVRGSGDYTIRAAGGILPGSSLENNDNFYDGRNGVRGEVRGGRDNYEVNGEITFIKYTNVGGDITLFRDRFF